MKKNMRRAMAFMLAMAMVLTLGGFSNAASAATKKMKLSATAITLKVGASKKITVKNAPKKAKITWNSKNKKIAKVSKAGKITAVKAGKTKITCKVVKNKTKKNFTVTVTVKKKTTVKPTVAPTVAPTVVPTVAPTVVPTAAPTDAATPEPTSVTEISNLTDAHQSANDITTKDNGLMRKDLSSKQMITLMGQGWNLGNTLEAVSIEKLDSVLDYEQAWGNIITTQATIDGIKKYGVNTVRIPVAWSNMISDDGKYTINTEYLDRVEEVINYCLNNEMYAIVNVHWDGGWWGQFGSSDQAIREKGWARFESFWLQIANRYKEYSDRLIFESANEEIGDRLNDPLDADGNPWSDSTSTGTKIAGKLGRDECYEMALKINQKFVDIVRNTGGNNSYRHLLLAGYDTDFKKTCDARFIMPTDIAENGNNKMSVSVHYYTPSDYCISESSNSWGYKETWGTEEDYAEMHQLFDMLTRFTDAGYGIMIGEYGVCNSSKDGIPQFIREVMQYSKKLGYLPIMWDTSLWYDRTNCVFKYTDVAQVFIDETGVDTKAPENGSMTGIPNVPVIKDEDSMKMVASWEGAWTRTDGSTKVGAFTTTATEGAIKISSNAYYWQLFFRIDWSTMTKPAIKVYTDELSKDYDLQIAYTDKKDGAWNQEANYQKGWREKIIALDKDMLEKYNYIMLSSNTPGATFTKIEIYDAK